MSIKTFFNSIREGFSSLRRHPFVTVASITTILLMLIILSVFFVFSANARVIMKKLGQQPPIEVYMKLNVAEDQLAMAEQLIREDTRIIEIVRRSPEENYYSFKANLGDSQSILDEFDYNNYLPYTFSVRITDPSLADEVVSRMFVGKAYLVDDGAAVIFSAEFIADYVYLRNNIKEYVRIMMETGRHFYETYDQLKGQQKKDQEAVFSGESFIQNSQSKSKKVQS